MYFLFCKIIVVLFYEIHNCENSLSIKLFTTHKSWFFFFNLSFLTFKEKIKNSGFEVRYLENIVSVCIEERNRV